MPWVVQCFGDAFVQTILSYRGVHQKDVFCVKQPRGPEKAVLPPAPEHGVPFSVAVFYGKERILRAGSPTLRACKFEPHLLKQFRLPRSDVLLFFPGFLTSRRAKT